MIIRVSDPVEDAGGIMAGVKDFISRMDFVDYFPKDERGVISVIGKVVTSESIEVLVAEHEEEIVGILIVAFVPYLWNPEITHAEELLWWVAQDAPKTAGLRLLRFARKRAKEIGADVMTFTALTSSPKNLGRIYERMGMREIETSYMGSV